MSINTTPTDYYILLDLNAWYGWNELTLMDMFSRIHVGDGSEVETLTFTEEVSTLDVFLVGGGEAGGSGIVIILSHVE